MADSRTFQADQHSITNLFLALRQLDQVLAEAVSTAQAIYGAEAAADPYRGLYINREDVEAVLKRNAGEPILRSQGTPPDEFIAEQSSHVAPLAWLKQTFGLSVFDLSTVLIALAPEVDLRYERIYAYLQDDVTRKHPSVDLVLNLLCPSAEAKLQQRNHFASSAPLLQHGLLHLIVDPNQLQPPLLSRSLKLDEQVIQLLLGQQGLDSRLATFCQLVQPSVSLEELPLSVSMQQALKRLTIQAKQNNQPLQFYFYGAHGMGKCRTAEAIAGTLNTSLLVANFVRAVDLKIEIEPILKLLCHTVQFQNVVLYVDHLDELSSQEQVRLYQQALAVLSECKGIVVFAGTQPWLPTINNSARVIPVDFPIPDFAQRRSVWESELNKQEMTLSAPDLDALANSFSLPPGQIADAVTTAYQWASWRVAQSADSSHQSPLPTSNELFMAARIQSGHDLIALTRKIEPKYSWNDIVLPTDQLIRLREICNQIKYRHVVYDQWGFNHKLTLGRGLNVLFSGSPGTGKTMAAEVLANELRLDLYQIDLSQIVSKYIGETEKNLNRIFTAAESTNTILLFDEADSLFGKRSEVKDAHDRYANIEVSYLLQKMEEYEGITILTTNLVQNLDEAFTRRLRFIIEFPFPDVEHRLSIWQGIFPKETPLAADIDFTLIAQQFKLAGGNIRNVALAAAFLAAESGQSVGMNHLLQATKREFQKMGRLVGEEDFLQFGAILDS